MANRFLKGRLIKGLSPDAAKFLFLEDVGVDVNLIGEEILSTKAHVVMLWKAQIIEKKDAAQLLSALNEAERLHAGGKFVLDPNLEDVHLNLESFVTSRVGPEVGGKLHTARSRNDQVLVDTRLHLRRELHTVEKSIIRLLNTMLRLARKHLHAVMPGYTHLQHAQPITFSHWLCGYCEMLLRDLSRIQDAHKRVNLSPIGSCAIAGTSFPVDRRLSCRLLGFKKVQTNTLDVVTSRGEEVAEVLAVFALLMMHLSRLSADLVLWSSHEFGFVEMDEAYATTSSVMPQKKNPDVAELIRAKAAIISGKLLAVLSILKSLPSGYNKDTQETKREVIEATKIVEACLTIVEGALSTLKVRKERMLNMAEANYSTALDLAELLVKKARLPFRDAYQVVGGLVRSLAERDIPLPKADAGQILEYLRASLKEKANLLSEGEVSRAINPRESVKAKASLGSPNPVHVKQQIRHVESELRRLVRKIEKRERQISSALQTLEKAVGQLIGGSRS